VKVEGVIANPPSYSALFTCGTGLISLTLDTKIHDVVSADRTVVNNDIPSPESNGAPLLNFESLSFLVGRRRGYAAGGFSGRNHGNVGV
jgi:hypothetical protein